MIELILMRHAKTKPATQTQTDHDRRLTPRGWDDAPRVARRLYSIGARPDIILLSDAKRCLETFEAMKDIFTETQILVQPALYLADPNVVWSNAQNAAHQHAHSSVMVIGHNPGMHELAYNLVGRDASTAANNVRNNYPTAAAACFRRANENTEWQLHTFLTAKELRPADCPPD
jgi:phosphohistidine phosphatase